MFKNKKLNEISNMTNPSDEKTIQKTLFTLIDGYLKNEITSEDILFDLKRILKDD